MDNQADELLDIVNGDDLVVDQKPRSEVYQLGLCNFRVVNAFLVNDIGMLWIPRRSPHKRIFPLCLDMSVGGHVETGETYEEAFRRESFEELGLRLDEVEWGLIGRLTPHTHGVSAFMQVYEIRDSRTPAYNRDDFTEFFWLSPQEVLAKIEAGDKAKDDLPRLIHWAMEIIPIWGTRREGCKKIERQEGK